jgi:hypothetical protein
MATKPTGCAAWALDVVQSFYSLASYRLCC